MKLAEPLIPVFGYELMKKILASDWHIREEGLKEVSKEISLGLRSNLVGEVRQPNLFTACFGVIAYTCGDKIGQVSGTAMDLIV